MVLPINRPFTVTAAFGEGGSLWADGHKGVDFVTDDRQVFSPCDGTVRVIAFDDGGWGQYVSIGDGDGRRHILCHLVKDSLLVKEGEKVKAGQRIAVMGKTGNVTGTHLHYQVNVDGIPINPADLLGIPLKRGQYSLPQFKDESEISAWAKAAVQTVAQKGLMIGDDKGNFNPKAYVTREEFAVVLSRLI